MQDISVFMFLTEGLVEAIYASLPKRDKLLKDNS